MSKHIYPLTCLFAFLIVFAGIFFPLISVTREFPGTTFYGFPMAQMGDYYTNIYRIRLGQEGILTYKNAYTDEVMPDTIFEPHYNIVGLLSKPFNLAPLEVYEIFRLLSIATFLFSVFVLIAVVLPSAVERVMACIFVIFATSFWKFAPGTGFHDIVSPLVFPPVYSAYFSIFQRFNIIKAHHYLAHAALIWILILFIQKKYTLRAVVFLSLASCALSFLHPYLLVYAIVFMATFAIVEAILTRKIPTQHLIRLAILAATAGPVIAYHGYVLTKLYRADIDIGGTLVWTKNMMATSTYIYAVGIVFFLAVPAIFLRRTWISSEKRIIALWAFLPFLFFLSNALKIPTSNDRIFQTNQFVPLAIMAAFSVSLLLKRLRIPVVGASVVICILFILYSIPSYAKSFSEAIHPRQNYFYIQNIRSVSLPVYDYFRKHAPQWSVVLGGENFSMILPVYADNKVIIGHPGTTPDFDQKLSFAKQVFWGQYPAENLQQTLKKYNVKYIVFGIENGSFNTSPYASLPFLKEVYSRPENGVSIVEVL